MAADAFKALGTYETFSPDVVVTDLHMPGMDGIELIKKIRVHEDAPAVVVMTAFGAVQTAVDAVRAGAADYLTKPVNFPELLVVLDTAMETRQLWREIRQLRARVGDRVAPENIVGNSQPMQRVFEIVDQVAPSRATVLITGESGTGKELIANAIHHRSPRSSGPFIKVHCAGLSEALLEAELFGSEKGAFTGVLTRQDGKLVQADGGTLFLDEVGDLPPALQIKLLRFLQESAFERVGGTQTVRADVRVIAATNRRLANDVTKGTFREDLFYRLNVASIDMPPLRDRRGDIPALARFFLLKYAALNDKTVEQLAPQTLEILVAYDWPGNVRELENAIERAIVLATSSKIEPHALPSTIQPAAGAPGAPKIPGSSMDELERYAILETLKSCGGSTSKAADVLGISTRTIQYRLHEYSDGSSSDIEIVRKLRSGTKTPA
jgi:DNA-binding NtrC family response regulator